MGHLSCGAAKAVRPRQQVRYLRHPQRRLRSRKGPAYYVNHQIFDVHRPCPSSSLGRAAPGTTLGAPATSKPFPAELSGLSTCRLANATGFSICRGSAQSSFFRFQRPNPALQRQMAFGTVACKSQWLFQLLEICTEPFFSGSKTAAWPFKPFPAASNGLSTCCLANASGFSSCRGSAQSSFFASKTAAWPLQTLPCSVQWPFHLLSCNLPNQMPVAFPISFQI